MSSEDVECKKEDDKFICKTTNKKSNEVVCEIDYNPIAGGIERMRGDKSCLDRLDKEARKRIDLNK